MLERLPVAGAWMSLEGVGAGLAVIASGAVSGAADVLTTVIVFGWPNTLPSMAVPSRKTLMLLPTTCARVILRIWPSDSLTEAPALKAAWLAAVAGMLNPADLRQTPFSQSVLVKLLIAEL